MRTRFCDAALEVRRLRRRDRAREEVEQMTNRGYFTLFVNTMLSVEAPEFVLTYLESRRGSILR